MAAVARRTSGSTSKSVGKATTHDSAQEPSHIRSRPGDRPVLRKVLIIDTMKVIRMDSSSGITQVAARAGSLRMPRKVREASVEDEEEGFMAGLQHGRQSATV